MYDNNNIEKLLKENRYEADSPDFFKVWKKFKRHKIEKTEEVYIMGKKNKGARVLVWLLSFMVIVGLAFFAITKINDAKRSEKIVSGEAILVTFVVGNVEISKMGSSAYRALYVDDTIEMGDSIKTGRSSFCEIQMVGRGVFRIEENSDLEIARLVNIDGKIDSRMKLGQGEIALTPRRTERGDTFEVETSVAVAAVRGTRFSVTSDEEGNVSVAVAEGIVEVKPNIASLYQAKEDGLISEGAVDILDKEIVIPVSVNKGEEVKLGKSEVDIMDRAIGSAIREVAQSEGPITEETLSVRTEVETEEVKPSISEKITVKTRENVNREVEVKIEEARTAGNQEEIVRLNRIAVAVAPEKSQRIETSSLVTKTELSEERVRKLDNVSQERLITDIVELVRFRIESQPAGAEVFIDNEKAGITPFSKNLVKGSKIEVKLVKDGFVEFSRIYEATTATMVVRENMVAKAVEPAADVVVEDTTDISETSDVVLVDETEIKETRIMPGDLEWNKSIRFTQDIKSPVVHRNRVYTTSGSELYILSLDGTIVNKVSVASGRNLSAPVIADNTVYMGSDRGGIYAYSLTGEKIWNNDQPGMALYDTSPGAGSGLVAAPSSDKGIKVFTKDGNLKASIDISEQIFSSPVIAANGKMLIYATERGEVIGYNLESGREAWKKDVYSSRIVSPIMGNNNVVAVFERGSGKLTGLNPNNGEIMWTRELAGAARARIAPVETGNRILVIDANETRLFVVNLNNGALMLSKAYPKISSFPYFSAANNTVYVGTANGQLHAYNLATQAEWSGNVGAGVAVVYGDADSAYAVTQSSMVKFFGKEKIVNQ